MAILQMSTPAPLAPSVPLPDLWWGLHPQGFRKGWFMVLHVHMDESYSDTLFAVSAVCGTGESWEKVSADWSTVLEATNLRLTSQHRPTISRYHAADCNSCRGEFKGWSLDEQRELQEQMSAILESNRLECVGVVVARQECVGLERYMDLKGWHGLAFMLVLDQVQRYFKDRDVQLSFIFDRADYAMTLSAIFEQFRQAPENVSRFVGISPEGWETCIPLQPADFFAFEIKKFGELNGVRRKTLARICNSKNFGGRIKFIQRKELEQLLARFQAMLDAANPDGEDWMEN